MARERRVLRLQQLILEILGDTLQSEALDPGLGLVTVTKVRLSPDLSRATFYWSCLARDQARERTASALARALPLLQRRVAEDLGTRVTPRLEARFDASLERAQRLDSIFHHIAEERGDISPEGAEEDPETLAARDAEAALAAEGLDEDDPDEADAEDEGEGEESSEEEEEGAPAGEEEPADDPDEEDQDDEDQDDEDQDDEDQDDAEDEDEDRGPPGDDDQRPPPRRRPTSNR